MATVPTFTDGAVLHASSLNYLLNPPASFTYAASAQTLTTGVSTVLNWDTGEGTGSSYDTDPVMWTVSAPSRITFNTPGKWRVTVNVLWVANATGNRQIDLRKNAGGSGAAGTRLLVDIIAAPSAGSATNNFTVVIPGIVAGDYIEAFGSQGSGGNLATLATNHVGAVGIWCRWENP